MQATQITLRNLKRSSYIARRIRQKCEHLEHFHPHVLYCRVAIEPDCARGQTRPLGVTVRVGIPRREIVSHGRDVNLHLALRHAFGAACRQLKDAASSTREPAPAPLIEEAP